MNMQQIKASDISRWESLEDIASTFEKRGLTPRPELGEENQLPLQLDDNEFIVLVKAAPGEDAREFKPDNMDRHTNLVATNDFDSFTFITRVRTWDQQHGRIKYQKLSFEKEQFDGDTGEQYTVLDKLNSIEYGSSEAIYEELYDTKRVVKEFYQQFEELRTELVQEVEGIPDGQGDAKQKYVQVVLDRMIFLYFIQEKRLLDYDTDYLRDRHDEIVSENGNVYEQFYSPLFFDMLGEGQDGGDFFGMIPYLNGGLFSKDPVEEKYKDARIGKSDKRTNELFDNILDFLSDWNWNVDERLDIVDPKNLSPEVLGHIFEQTVNQKEMGAYYSPEEITGFMARRTIHPYILSQLNEAVQADYETIDDVFGFSDNGSQSTQNVAVDGGAITRQAPAENIRHDDVETLYFDILKDTKILDPAVGSGAFLLAAQEVLLDIYMQCIEYFREEDAWRLSSTTKEELETIEASRGTPSLYAKREIILNNLYGVDIDDGAVEICKLRLWLSMVADIEDEPREVDPLPNIDFNIRQGNALIGFTDLVEVANDDGDASLNNYGGGVGTGVQELYDDVIEAVENHREATSSEVAAEARREAENLIEDHSEVLNEKVLEKFEQAGINHVDKGDIQDFHPFHWVLEFATVYRDGGFDVLIGNPPWDRLKPVRDDYFSKFDEKFRTRLPEDKDATQEELLDKPHIRKGWEEYQRKMETRAEFFNESEEYELQSPDVGGRSHGTENDLSALFFERVFELASDDSYVSQILPGAVFTGSSTKDLRLKLLNEASVESVVTFENKGIFEAIDNRYNFGIVTFRNSGETDELNGIFTQRQLSVLTNLEQKALDIPRRVLAKYSPEARIFPMVDSQEEVDALNTILKHHPVSEPDDHSWYAQPYRELDRTQDADRFVESSEEGDYPVLGGSNIFQYCYDPTFVSDLEGVEFWSVEDDPEKSAKNRIREKNHRKLKQSLFEAFDGRGTQKQFVNDLLEEHRGESLSEDDVLLDCTEYRIVYRDIARAADERTLIASVIPPGWVCHNTLHTIRPYEINPQDESVLTESPLHGVYQRIFSDEELFVAVGLLNSIPFDFLMRTKTDTHIVMYKFEESQVPHLMEGDDWFDYISSRAARLNCYGDRFAEMRDRLGGISAASEPEERQQLRIEIDAAAFHAYGMTREEVEFILADFHRVSSPRVMTEEYFDQVLHKFDELEASSPRE